MRQHVRARPTRKQRRLPNIGVSQVHRINKQRSRGCAKLAQNRTDTHITRTPLVLDDQGFDDLSAMLTEVLERANKIQDEAADRLNKEKEGSVPTMMAILHFETPSES